MGIDVLAMERDVRCMGIRRRRSRMSLRGNGDRVWGEVGFGGVCEERMRGRVYVVVGWKIKGWRK